MILGFCQQTAEIFKFVGEIVRILKICIPIILIVIGVIGLGKAVVAQKDDDIKKETQSLIKKAIVAVCIFFIPTIVEALFTMVGGFSDVKNDYEVCVKCVTNPSSCEVNNN